MPRFDPAKASAQLHRVCKEPGLSTADLVQLESFLSSDSTEGPAWSSAHIGFFHEATSFLSVHADEPHSDDTRTIKANVSRLLHSYERSFWLAAMPVWQTDEPPTAAQLLIEELVFGPRRLTVGAIDWVQQDAWRADFRTSLIRVRDLEIAVGHPLRMRVVAALHYAQVALEYFLGSGADDPPPSPHTDAPEWVRSLHACLPPDVVVVLSHWLVPAITHSTSRPPQTSGAPAIPTRVPRHLIGDSCYVISSMAQRSSAEHPHPERHRRSRPLGVAADHCCPLRLAGIGAERWYFGQIAVATPLSQFSRDMFESTMDVDHLCSALAEALLPRLRCATDPISEARAIVADLRGCGHELCPWSESDDHSIWGDNYVNPPRRTRFLLEMRWNSADEPMAEPELRVTFGPWPAQRGPSRPTWKTLEHMGLRPGESSRVWGTARTRGETVKLAVA